MKKLAHSIIFQQIKVKKNKKRLCKNNLYTWHICTHKVQIKNNNLFICYVFTLFFSIYKSMNFYDYCKEK